MNTVILMGRLTGDPRVTVNGEHTVARYTLAVDRRFTKDGERITDFPSCVVFGKGAEFADKYLRKGVKIIVKGRLQTGKFERDGQTIYTTDVVVEEQEFAESKRSENGDQAAAPAPAPSPSQADKGTPFMDIPAGAEDDLPFN